MIDENRFWQMAREYEMNPSVVRRLLENARDVSALRIGRKYREGKWNKEMKNTNR